MASGMRWWSKLNSEGAVIKTKKKSTKHSVLKEAQANGVPTLLNPNTFDVAEIFGIVPLPKQRRPVKLSRIRVQLNRPLTEAEVEDITHRGIQFRLSVSVNRLHVFAEGAMDSRRMYPIVAKVLAENYVNLIPRAVRTFTEYRRPSGR